MWPFKKEIKYHIKLVGVDQAKQQLMELNVLLAQIGTNAEVLKSRLEAIYTKTPGTG